MIAHGIDVDQMTPEELDSEWEHLSVEDRNDAFRENLQAAISAHMREDEKGERVHRVFPSYWVASWDRTHRSKHARLKKAPGAQERMLALLETKEWSGSETTFGTYYDGRAMRPGIRLRHSSGAQCILWELKPDERVRDKRAG